MVEHLNEIFKKNDIMVKIYNKWYRLDEVGISPSGRMDISVSDEDGEEFTHFDMSDVEEFDPTIKLLEGMDNTIIGVA